MSRRPRFDLGSPTLSEAFEQLRADYGIGKRTRFNRQRAGVGSVGHHADWHVRNESQYWYGMEVARDQFRNDIVIGQAVRRLVSNVIQDGFRLDVNTGDKALDEDLGSRWLVYSSDADECDLAGEHDFHALENLTLLQTIVDGDVCNLPTSEESIEQIEAHRLRTPTATKRNVVYGVLLDDRRRRLEYWFSKEDVSPMGSVRLVSDVERYPARAFDPMTGREERAVFHCYRPDRISQTRGITAFAPLSDSAERLEDILFASLVGAQCQTSYAILEELPPEASIGPGAQTGPRTTETQSDGSERTLEGTGPGMRIRGSPGAKLHGFSPTIPGPQFKEHVILTLSLIAVNLGLPVQLLLLDPKQTNFSGWRGAMDQARLGFRSLQLWLAGAFHRPVYRWKVRQWMAADPALRRAAARSGIRIFDHAWHPPRWPYIEPLTDGQAHLLRTRNLLTSPRRGAAELGDEWATIVRETVDDNALAIVAARERAAEINQKDPEQEPVSWRDLLSLPTPDRVTFSMSQTSPAAGDAAQPAAAAQQEF